MELLPPISASLGAMVSVAGKLDALQLDTELKDEVNKLKTRLLKLSKARDPSATVSTWMNDVRELSYDMDNCVDAWEDWIEQIPGFKTRVKKANGRYDRYIPESLPSHTDVVPIADHRFLTVDGGPKQRDLVVGLYGTGGPVDKLCHLLSDGDEHLKVLSIFGAGGIGKTTLAKELWRKQKPGDFDCRAFVRTAKKPDMRRILRSILAQVRPHQPPDANEVHELIRDLSEHLKDKRYLLIIDDLWDTSVWDVACRAFPAENHGSRIITTTEIEDVALACCSYQSTCIFEMVPLSDSQSKELFTSALLRSGEQYYPQLEEVTDEIIKRCAGLPQAIVSISSVIASQGEANALQNIEDILINFPTNTTTGEILKQVLKFYYNCLPSFLRTCIYPENYIRRCAGLSQAIISISSVLASQGEANTVQNREQIQNSSPTNTSSGEIQKQVLKFCYNCLPGCLQTCLLYLSLYPENYIILKDDIMKQWVAEGFILAPTYNEKMEVARSYFEKLVSMGLIQHIVCGHSDEVLYYAVHHMVHDFITSNSIKENFVAAIDYSQRTVRFSNNVSRLSLQFGSATYATKPDSIGLLQVRSLAFIGLKSCFPPNMEFKFLRFLILHIWADQPSTGFKLGFICELVLLRSLQVTSNDNVHLPDLKKGPNNLETLEINARMAAIPANIFHIRSWLHLRLGVGTEQPDVTGILKSATLNPPISLDESSSPPDSVKTIELLSPIFRIPKWIGQLTNICSLKMVVRELQKDDISNLKGLPSLTVLSLYIQERTEELISFVEGAFPALEYLDFRCGVLRLIFEEGTMPNLQSLKLGFNAHEGEQYGPLLTGIEHLKNIQEIVGIIGSVAGAEDTDLLGAESSFMAAIGDHPSYVRMKRVDMVEEGYGPAEKQHVVREKGASSEQLAIQEQKSKEGIQENASSDSQSIQRRNNSKEDANYVQGLDMVEEEYGPAEKQHAIRDKDISSEQLAIPKQESEGDIKKNAGRDSRFIERRSNSKGYASVAEGLSENQELGSSTHEKDDMKSLKRGNTSMNLKLSVIETITNGFSDDQKIGSGGYGDVYKAMYNGEEIAVKKLHFLQGLDDKQLYSEFLNLTKVSHKNVVRLIGYCYECRHKSVERVLCYEYMQRGSIGKHIGDEYCEFDWLTCYEIIKGTCEGLNHLHAGLEKPIFHLYLKPSNILLDKSTKPRIADLGLSKLVSYTETHKTEMLKGIQDYMPPEYIEGGHISEKFDVFSLGVIIIRIIAGNKGYSRRSEMSHKQFLELVSESWTKRLQAVPGYPSHDMDILRVRQCAAIALRCVEKDGHKRPYIKDIVHELEELDAGIKKMSLTSDLRKDLTVQRSCDSNVMAVDPTLELRFVFEPRKEISCCLLLTNKTKGLIAFRITMNKTKYRARPSNGTLPPYSARYITVTMLAQAEAPAYMWCNDMFLVQSASVSESEDNEINYEELFEKAMAEKVVDVVKMPIVYIALSDQSLKNPNVAAQVPINTHV